MFPDRLGTVAPSGHSAAREAAVAQRSMARPSLGRLCQWPHCNGAGRLPPPAASGLSAWHIQPAPPFHRCEPLHGNSAPDKPCDLLHRAQHGLSRIAPFLQRVMSCGVFDGGVRRMPFAALSRNAIAMSSLCHGVVCHRTQRVIGFPLRQMDEMAWHYPTCRYVGRFASDVGLPACQKRRHQENVLI